MCTLNFFLEEEDVTCKHGEKMVGGQGRFCLRLKNNHKTSLKIKYSDHKDFQNFEWLTLLQMWRSGAAKVTNCISSWSTDTDMSSNP